MPTRAERFHRLFAGLDRAHGEYVVAPGAKPNGRGKVEGRALTVHAPVTVALWERHLAGTDAFGLGVVPIRDDATVRFGAIDVDVYPLDVPKLLATVTALGLPLVPCRTKSGGAHLYLFGAEDLPAALVRAKLMEWAVLLGHGGVEVFPKQVRLAGETDYGNWINLPYQGGERSLRYAQGPERALTPDEFLDAAEKIAVTVERLTSLVPLVPPGPADQLAEGPPCLQTLARSGFPEGTRNNALFNLAVYAKKAHPVGWEARVGELNRALIAPPLSSAEVSAVVKSAGKRDYRYRCKEQPIVSACNRQLCLTRQFGVGGLPDDPGIAIGELVKVLTDPVTWIVDVNGTRLELATAELMDQRLFHAKVFENLSLWPVVIKPGTWHRLIDEKLAAATEVEVPEDATPEGQWWVHLGRFCTGRAQARTLDELLLAKPFTDAAAGRTYFCATDALAYLHQQRVPALTEKRFYTFLRRRGVAHHFQVVKGKPLNYWSVPAFAAQTEAFEVPRAENRGDF